MKCVKSLLCCFVFRGDMKEIKEGKIERFQGEGWKIFNQKNVALTLGCRMWQGINRTSTVADPYEG